MGLPSLLLQLNFESKMNGFKVANPGIFIFGRPLALFLFLQRSVEESLVWFVQRHLADELSCKTKS